MTGSFNDSAQLAILVTAVAGLVTTMITLYYNFKREDRRHKWEIEAAERHRAVAQAASSEREVIAKRVEDAEVVLNAKLDANTEISQKAFDEANHLNEKIATQGQAFDRMLQTALASRRETDTKATANALLEEVAATTTDTHEKVVEIRDRVVGE